MRRSKRAAAKRAKQRTKAIQDYEDSSTQKVLAGALPPINEPSIKKFNRLNARERIPLSIQRGKRENKLTTYQSGPSSRHILFMNVGDDRIMEAIQWKLRGGERPAWTNNLNNLEASGMTLYLNENGRRPFALKEQKRAAVKKLYFDPSKPSTIQPITDNLRLQYCNISRKNVRDILRSLEAYQLMRPRRQVPKIEHHTNYNKPGVIAADSFFPSGKTGWQKTNVLVIMDVYSRFSRAYAIETRDAKFYKIAIVDFLQEFTSLGHMPRRFLSDKGTELAVATEIMERYRQKRDGDKPLHLKSFTGTPVLVVEALNAQYQRRLEPYIIAGLHNDAGNLLWSISEQINNQRRPRRGNHTPYELLSLSDRERKLLNDKFSDKFYGVGIEAQKKLPLLKNGDHVRKLMMTVKEQIENKKKGFQAKWSKKVYQVLGKRALKRNRYVYRYQIGDPKRTYLRHELLLIPKKVDREVLMIQPTGSLRVQDFYTGQET